MTAWSSVIDYLAHEPLLLQTATLVVCVLSSALLTGLVRAIFQHRLKRISPSAQQSWLNFSPVLATLIIILLVLLLRRWLKQDSLDVSTLTLSVRFLMLYVVLVFLRFSAVQGIAHLPISHSTLDFSSRLVTRAFWGAMALYVLNLWFDWVDLLHQASITLGGRSISVFDIAQGLFFLILTIVIAIWVGTLISKLLMRAQPLHIETRMILSRFARALIIFIALLLGLSFSGLDLTVLSVFGGALGIGLGLGLQRIVSNYMSGLVVLIDKSIQINDYIVVDKYEGVVQEINARYSIVRSLAGIESIIPNEALVLNGVRNYSFSSVPTRVTVTFYLNLSTDVNAALALAITTMASVPRVLNHPLPEAFLNNVLPMAYEVELGFWLADYHRGTGDVQSAVNLAILKAWQDAGFELAQNWDINTLLLQRLKK